MNYSDVVVYWNQKVATGLLSIPLTRPSLILGIVCSYAQHDVHAVTDSITDSDNMSIIAKCAMTRHNNDYCRWNRTSDATPLELYRIYMPPVPCTYIAILENRLIILMLSVKGHVLDWMALCERYHIDYTSRLCYYMCRLEMCFSVNLSNRSYQPDFNQLTAVFCLTLYQPRNSKS